MIAGMFEPGDAVSFEDEDGLPQKRFRVVSVEPEGGAVVVRMVPVIEPAKDGEDAEA